ncbi:hypothetical protein HUA74_17800 [Myxococcus sp. CA051A]|uniref:hypothetical protein n=1 Tax=unclassified Myxococcus TaxID=2648731 RepID=UPI00157A3C3F|nr:MULTISPECIES: hypothetical protein [unclassified Myxococcus]NTX13893.1 hypothetical protein [Myxococcus sp. CA056]NTX36851.1 hypothetical protein [Myxococcus sp. CA033]NTX62510.1 hypothetical protein [Myxococcus sp. CA051A]
MKTAILSLGVLLSLGASPALGKSKKDEACTEPCGARSRQLKDHTFLFPMLQGSAFVTTNVGIREGLARYDVPDVPVNELEPRDVLLTGIQQTLDLSLGITDWLGFTGFGRATIITGSNADGLLASGASVDLVGQLGGVVRILRSDTSGTQLSFRANYGYNRGREITLLPLISAIVDSPGVTVGGIIDGDLGQLLFVPRKESSTKGGLYVAQSFGRVFSLQASGAAEYAWQTRRPFDSVAGGRFEQNTHALRVSLSLAATLDIYPVTAVPLAVMGEYVFRTGFQERVGQDDRTLKDSTAALGIYYSGRANLQLGLGAVRTFNAEPHPGLGARGRTLESGEPSLSYGELILRYVW